MDVATTSAAERIARVLAGWSISANGAGDTGSAASLIERAWKDYLPDAAAVLRTLREPSHAMAEAGDPVIWERMILAAIKEASPATVPL